MPDGVRRAIVIFDAAGHGAPIVIHSAKALICGVSQLRGAARHLRDTLRMADGLHQQAGVGIAGHDRRTGIAALEQALPGVQPQAAFLVRGMTVEARVDEHRPDLRFEEFDLLGRAAVRGQLRRAARRTQRRRRKPRSCAGSAEHAVEDAGRFAMGTEAGEAYYALSVYEALCKNSCSALRRFFHICAGRCSS